MKQLDLFDTEAGFTNRSVKAVTFQGKMDRPIHRWYRLTPSFSPRLADDVATHFGLGGGDLVLDPFSGVGTVPLCMKHRGVPSCSIEINPYLKFVSTIKTRTYSDASGFDGVVTQFLAHLDPLRRALPDVTDASSYIRENAIDVPPIHRPERWWSPGNLMQLVCIRKGIASFQAEGRYVDLLKMGILAILVPCSNAKHNHVSLTFDVEPAPDLDVAGLLRAKYREMVDDLHAVASLADAEVNVFGGNSRDVAGVLPGDLRPTAVITSPPYPNRFSYARETRPHLFFFDFIDDAEAVGRLETEAIGGTWGRATSILADGIEPANDFIASLLSPYTRGIGDDGMLMASYVIKYFNNIYDHAASVALACAEKCQLAYVIGNSKFYGHPLPSDEILAAIFGHHGFDLVRIDRMRRRQSKAGLYEAVVFMKRG